jgi:hypothetical protein
MASGILFILVDGIKPTKSSKENNYVSKGIRMLSCILR